MLRLTNIAALPLNKLKMLMLTNLVKARDIENIKKTIAGPGMRYCILTSH